MRSKTSKQSPKALAKASPWKVGRGCSERALRVPAQDLARELNPGDCVLLEGPLGAGKSTFARLILEALNIEQAPEGSPTFAIAHEYTSPLIGEVVHADLYRIRNEQDLENAGILAYLWERSACVLLEWPSLFPQLLASLQSSTANHRVGRKIWRVELVFSKDAPELRDFRIELEPRQTEL